MCIVNFGLAAESFYIYINHSWHLLLAKETYYLSPLLDLCTINYVLL